MAYVHIWGATRISPLLFFLFFNSGQIYCLGFSVCGSEGVDGGSGGVRLAGNVMRSGSTLEIKEAILHLMPKKKGCPVSLDPWSECSLLLLALMNGRCFMCMCCEVARRTGAFIFLCYNNLSKN